MRNMVFFPCLKVTADNIFNIGWYMYIPIKLLPIYYTIIIKLVINKSYVTFLNVVNSKAEKFRFDGEYYRIFS